MKKTLIFFSLLLSFSYFAQNYSTAIGIKSGYPGHGSLNLKKFMSESLAVDVLVGSSLGGSYKYFWVECLFEKNRRILEKLNPTGKSTVDGISLAEEGFNFHYYTNIYKTQKGGEYFFCYEFGYKKLDNDQYILVIKQDYVK